MSNKLELTATDINAVTIGDSNYINNKGAKFYVSEKYDLAVEYYRLAASMGNVHAISNLGYCYLYGRDIEPNLSLAIAYFKIAAASGDVDAAYKLGDIYGSEKRGVKDKELSIYYYQMAAKYAIGKEWENCENILWCDELNKYPSLCYAFGRELSPGGYLNTDIDSAYQFLKHAELGYKKELANGNEMYRSSLNGVMDFLDNPMFDELRDRYDESFLSFYDDSEVYDED